MKAAHRVDRRVSQSLIGTGRECPISQGSTGTEKVVNARIMRLYALLTVAVLQIAVESHATDRQRKAADATSTAVCVRNAILKADAELKTTPGDNVTEDVRKQLRKEFEVSDAVARTEVKLCLSEDDVYWLGWYEQMDTSQLEQIPADVGHRLYPAWRK
ncbi:uncharacterized protein YecT (DUF1311 family) [Nitrobacteraceae bacterium AZCC 2161]